MGLRGTIAAAVNSAFLALGDIPTSATYRRTTTVYVPATGTNTSTNADTLLAKVIFLRFTELELSNNVGLQISDVKMIVQQSSLNVSPNIALDTVVTTAKTYNIVNFNPDPSGAIWTFQLRSP
jgi:hypothetical protein